MDKSEKDGIRVGISALDDGLLEKVSAESYDGVLSKKEWGRLLIHYGLEHFSEVTDWYRRQGIDVVAEAKKRKS